MLSMAFFNTARTEWLYSGLMPTDALRPGLALWMTT